MNESYFSNNYPHWKGVIRKVNVSSILNPLDSNTSAFFNDISIIIIDNLPTQKQLVARKCWHCKNLLDIS